VVQRIKWHSTLLGWDPAGMSGFSDARRITWSSGSVLLVVALSLLLATGCGEANLAGGDIKLTGFRGVSVPVGLRERALAVAVARSMLATVRLSAAAKPESDPPRGSPIRRGAPTPATPNLVDFHRTWRVPGQPEAVIDAVRKMRPAGLTEANSASAGQRSPGEPHGHEYWWDVGFTTRAAPHLDSEQLAISTAAAPGGGTLLRADAQVVWEALRPAGERVPAGVATIEAARVTTREELLEQELKVSGRKKAHLREITHGVVTLRRVISIPSAVRKIIAAIDQLPIVQPGTIVCPAEPGGPVARLMFRSRADKVLAFAGQRAGSQIGYCDPMYFSIEGHEQKQLADGGRVIDVVSRLLGMKLLPG
jgi:hypothetical protein